MRFIDPYEDDFDIDEYLYEYLKELPISELIELLTDKDYLCIHDRCVDSMVEEFQKFGLTAFLDCFEKFILEQSMDYLEDFQATRKQLNI